MIDCDLIIHNANQLVTCAAGGRSKRGAAMSDVGLIVNGALAIKDKTIIAAGKSSEIMREFASENTIDASGKTVAPGFVDCHTHVVYAGNRLDEFELKIKGVDYLEILESGGGILSTVRKTRETELKEIVIQSRRRLDKMLRLGTTTCEIKTGYGLDAETELKMLAAIFALDKIHPIDLVPTFLPAHAVPPEFRTAGENGADVYAALICEKMLPSAMLLYWMDKIDLDERKKRVFEEINSQIETGQTVGIGAQTITEDEQRAIFARNPFFVDVFCEKNAFNLEQSRKVLEAGKKLGFKLKAHVDEFTNLGGARMAIELGAVSVDHLDAISDDEISLLSTSETIGVVTPTVNFNFGAKEFADARKLIDSGCAVAVSTDYNPGSAPCPSLPNAMAIACRYQKMTPAETFNAATINAAFAVGLGAKVGSIETGKQADVLIFDTDDYREIAYEFGGNLVSQIIKRGAVIKL